MNFLGGIYGLLQRIWLSYGLALLEWSGVGWLVCLLFLSHVGVNRRCTEGGEQVE